MGLAQIKTKIKGKTGSRESLNPGDSVKGGKEINTPIELCISQLRFINLLIYNFNMWQVHTKHIFLRFFMASESKFATNDLFSN